MFEHSLAANYIFFVAVYVHLNMHAHVMTLACAHLCRCACVCAHFCTALMVAFLIVLFTAERGE